MPGCRFDRNNFLSCAEAAPRSLPATPRQPGCLADSSVAHNYRACRQVYSVGKAAGIVPAGGADGAGPEMETVTLELVASGAGGETMLFSAPGYVGEHAVEVPAGLKKGDSFTFDGDLPKDPKSKADQAKDSASESLQQTSDPIREFVRWWVGSECFEASRDLQPPARPHSRRSSLVQRWARNSRRRKLEPAWRRALVSHRSRRWTAPRWRRKLGSSRAISLSLPRQRSRQ